MKKEWVTTDDAEIQRVTGDYHEQLYSNKIDNLKDMDGFLENINRIDKPLARLIKK